MIGLFTPPTILAQTKAATPPAITIKPGDVVRVTVWRKPELSGEFEVGADGTIRHPLYQTIEVAGVPLPTAESRLRSFLQQYETNPSFILEPLFRVTVGGEVRMPNVYTLSSEATVAQAVAQAGGFTERSMVRRVRLYRGNQELFVDLTRPDDGLAQQPIRSGDQIVVDRQRSVFREYVAPVASIAGAIAAIVSVYIRTR
jgi:polysaccharide export outer membrane protein